MTARPLYRWRAAEAQRPGEDGARPGPPGRPVPALRAGLACASASRPRIVADDISPRVSFTPAAVHDAAMPDAPRSRPRSTSRSRSGRGVRPPHPRASPRRFLNRCVINRGLTNSCVTNRSFINRGFTDSCGPNRSFNNRGFINRCVTNCRQDQDAVPRDPEQRQGAHLFGRIVVSEIEVPKMFVDLV
jgi:hypothetical protein